MRCLFSGAEADSDEHVIPLWLQQRMRLGDERYLLPNRTALKYKHLRVPAQTEHNHTFGRIESRIARGEFLLDEVYLWALKIHCGLILRDTTLRSAVRDPESPPLLNADDFASHIGYFRMLYNAWANGGRTNPAPLGSVFVVESLTPEDQFDLIHCLITGTVGIDIGRHFILVHLWDQGDGLSSSILEHWERYHAPAARASLGTASEVDVCYMAHHVWALEGAYWLYRHRREFKFINVGGNVHLIPPLIQRGPIAVSREMYARVCRNFGLVLEEFGENGGHKYSPLVAKDDT